MAMFANASKGKVGRIFSAGSSSAFPGVLVETFV
jgi:hypothetical protein